MGECCERTIDNSPRDRSNGLGQRIVESDGTTNTSLIYDERWRLISRSEAGKYTEETLYHHAGLDGMGGASDIDGVILRRTFLATGTPQTEEKRWYVLQNWRQDAAVIISDAGVQRERAFYSPYGRVFGMPAGDLNFDGEFTSAEATTISGWSAGYRAYADINLDGVIDGDDATANTPGALGWDALSRDGSTIGYAGYVQDSSIPTLSHVRHRVYKSDLGRWVQRDPAGYVDGANLYEYAMSSPVMFVDPMGLASIVAPGGGCGGGVGVDSCGGGTGLQPAAPRKGIAQVDCDAIKRDGDWRDRGCVLYSKCLRSKINPQPRCEGAVESAIFICCIQGGSTSECDAAGRQASKKCIGVPGWGEPQIKDCSSYCLDKAWQECLSAYWCVDPTTTGGLTVWALECAVGCFAPPIAGCLIGCGIHPTACAICVGFKYWGCMDACKGYYGN